MDIITVTSQLDRIPLSSHWSFTPQQDNHLEKEEEVKYEVEEGEDGGWKKQQGSRGGGWWRRKMEGKGRSQ